MSRDLSGTYTLPENTQAITGETLSSVKYNAINDDIAAALNAPWPASAGFEQAIVQSLPTASDMTTATLTDSEVVTVTGGYSGEPETFVVDTGSILTPNGTTVIGPLAVGGNAVSTRLNLADFLELDLDPRQHADGTFLYVNDLGSYEVVASGEDITLSSGLKVRLNAPNGVISVENFGPDGTVTGDTTAIKAAIARANGDTIKFEAKRYFYDGSYLGTTDIRFSGAGMPQVNATNTALEGSGVTIIEGGLFSGAENVDLRDLGVDVGADSAASEQDGIKATHGSLNAGGHAHLENVVALGKSPASTFHAIVLESYNKVTGGNLKGVRTLFGCVMKCTNIQLTNIDTDDNGSVGTYLKSDNTYGMCRQAQIDSVRATNAGNYGLFVQADGASLGDVQFGKVYADGCNSTVYVEATTSGVDIRNIQIGDIISKNSVQSDVRVSTTASSGIYSLTIGSLTTEGTQSKVIEALGVGTIYGLSAGRIYASYVNGASQGTMDGAISIPSIVGSTNFGQVDIVENFGFGTKNGGINYANNGFNNKLDNLRGKVFGIGRPKLVVDTHNLSGVSASIILPDEYSSSGRTHIRVQPAASTEVTSITAPNSTFAEGHILTLINNSLNSMTINHNGGGGILNKGSANITVNANDAVSYIFGGAVWHSIGI